MLSSTELYQPEHEKLEGLVDNPAAPGAQPAITVSLDHWYPISADAFKEEDVKRDEEGKFAKQTGSGTAKQDVLSKYGLSKEVMNELVPDWEKTGESVLDYFVEQGHKLGLIEEIKTKLKTEAESKPGQRAWKLRKNGEIRFDGFAAWGVSHSGSTRIRAGAAELMGIEGWKPIDPVTGEKLPADREAKRHARKYLEAIKESPGSPEILYSGFANTRNIEWPTGGKIRLPLVATAGTEDTVSYGMRSDPKDQSGEPTLMEFSKGTKAVGYSNNRTEFIKEFGQKEWDQEIKDKEAGVPYTMAHEWSEAITAGEFEITGTSMGKTHAGREYRIVSLKPLGYFDPDSGKWEKTAQDEMPEYIDLSWADIGIPNSKVPDDDEDDDSNDSTQDAIDQGIRSFLDLDPDLRAIAHGMKNAPANMWRELYATQARRAGWASPYWGDAEFKEERVKRDDRGRFAEKASGSAGAPAVSPTYTKDVTRFGFRVVDDNIRQKMQRLEDSKGNEVRLYGDKKDPAFLDHWEFYHKCEKKYAGSTRGRLERYLREDAGLKELSKKKQMEQQGQAERERLEKLAKWQREVIDQVANKLDYPPGQVDVVPDSDMPTRIIGGREVRIAGLSYRSEDETGIGYIEISDKIAPEYMPGLLAHEIFHQMHDTLERNPSASAAFDKTVEEYGNTLQETDGVSEYTRNWWRQAEDTNRRRDFIPAIRETLADMAKLKQETGSTEAPHPKWAYLYSLIEASYGQWREEKRQRAA